MAAIDKQVKMQRIRIGLTGLAAVVLMVAAAAAIFESASDEQPVAPGNATQNQMASEPSAVANMLAEEEEVPNEPLAEIGVAPAIGPTEAEKAAQAEQKPTGDIKQPPIAEPTL